MKKRVLIAFILIISLMLYACGGGGCGDSGSEDEQDTETTQTDDGDEQQENEPQDSEGKDIITEMKIMINGKEFIAALSDNETARALIEMLPMTVNMSAMAHEKYYYLSSNLPTAAYNPYTIQAGDIMLWGANCLVLFYESFSTSYSYTKIGKIENTAGLTAAVGSGNVIITFSAN